MFSDKFYQLLNESEASEKQVVEETTPVTLNRTLLVLVLFKSYMLQNQTYLLLAGVKKKS